MSDATAKLDAALAEIKSRFDAEQTRERGLAEKRAEIDRAIAQCREEQVRIQGEYRAVEKLKLDAEPPATDKAN